MTDFLDDEPSISELDGIRYLHFSSPWIQGAMKISRPNELVLDYTKQMMAWVLYKSLEQDDKVAILGLGAGSLLRYVVYHTKAKVESIERNPLVTAICRSYFRLPGIDRSRIIHKDAQDWVANTDNHNSFSVIMVDLYDASAQGPVCDSVEFYKNCYNCLDENGIATINLFGNHPSFQHNLDNIDAAFNSNYLVLPITKDENTVVLAFKNHIDTKNSSEFIDNAQRLAIRYKLPTDKWARALLNTGAKK